MLVSLMMAVSALSIDLMLPAFAAMRDSFGLDPDSTEIAGIVTAFLLGLAVAQLAYGPLADRFGRKPVLYGGFAIFAVGAAGAALAPSLTWLLAARFVWGIGAAAPRVLGVTIIRDVYEGDRMARAMSFVMAIFIIVPIFAPFVGALIVAVAPWRWVFWFCVLYVTVIAVWTMMRLPETLNPAHRIAGNPRAIVAAIREVTRHPRTMSYGAMSIFLFGAFITYLSTSEIIISDVFRRPNLFPIIFGGLATVAGLSVLTNTRVISRLGTRRALHRLLVGYLLAAIVVLALALAWDGRPPIVVFIVGFAVLMAMHSMLIPTVNTYAMGPVGHVAGSASAVLGTVATAGGALIGALLSPTFNGTILPLSWGFAGAGVIAVGLALWTERGRLDLVGPNRT